jgi:hypothetical protein
VARSERRRLVRRNSIPLTAHGLYEYGAGVLFIAAPFLFNFETDGPKVLAALVGAGLLVLAGATDSPTGLVTGIPIPSHIVVDYVLGLFLIGAPFLFAFTDDTPAFAFFCLLGVAHLFVAVTTRYRKPQHPG